MSTQPEFGSGNWYKVYMTRFELLLLILFSQLLLVSTNVCNTFCRALWSQRLHLVSLWRPARYLFWCSGQNLKPLMWSSNASEETSSFPAKTRWCASTNGWQIWSQNKHGCKRWDILTREMIKRCAGPHSQSPVYMPPLESPSYWTHPHISHTPLTFPLQYGFHIDSWHCGKKDECPPSCAVVFSFVTCFFFLCFSSGFGWSGLELTPQQSQTTQELFLLTFVVRE